MSLRIIKILLVVSIAAWALINAIGNLMFYNYWLNVVGLVMAVENVPSEAGRAITSPLLHTIGYAFIYLPKFAAGIFCGWGAYDMWRVRNEPAEHFEKAKYRFYIGCGIAMIMLIFGFEVLAGAFFSPGGTPSELAKTFHSFVSVYLISIGVAFIFVATPEPKVKQ
jgi:predicted small integral membrane protein